MRIKRFDVSTQLIKDILGPGIKYFEATENAILGDAELVRISVNENESTIDRISLFFTSASFPDLPEGTVLKGETIIFVKHYDPSISELEKGE